MSIESDNQHTDTSSRMYKFTKTMESTTSDDTNIEREFNRSESDSSLEERNQDSQGSPKSIDLDDDFDYDVTSGCIFPNSKTYSAEGKKVYTCHECKYVTDRKNNLKRHIVTMHEKCTKALECCDRVFLNKASLREHVISCHKNGYDCRICGRNFCRKALLKRHITVHSGQKDFVCNVCGYATSHKSNLDRHKRRHIPKELRHRFPVERGTRRRSDKERHFPRLTGFQKLGYDESRGAENHLPAAIFGPPFCYASHLGDYSLFRNTIPGHLWKPPQKIPFKRWMLPEDEEERSNSGEMGSPGRIPPQYLTAGQQDRNSVHVAGGSDHGMEEGDRLRLTRKRLFPKLHRCKGCEMVFDNQLQLSRHVDREHPATAAVAPQRPLTLLIRPKAVLPWRFF